MPWTLAILCICAISSALLLFQLRRKPATIGETPHCGKCGYTLTGNQSGRCPECGLELTPANIVKGQYRKRRLLPILALLSVAGVVYFGQLTIRQGDWYSYRPVNWVIEDAYSPLADVAERAWRELNSRRSLGKLDDAAEDKIVELALASYAKPRDAGGPLEQRLIEHLLFRYTTGKLSPGQIDRFYSQSFTATLHARSTIVAGDELPIDVRIELRAGGGMSRVVNKTASIGGPKLERHILEGTGPRYSGSLTAIKIDKPGIYTLTVEEDFSPVLIPRLHFNDEFPWTRHLLFTAKVEVLEKAPPNLIKWIDKPELASGIAKLLSAEIIDQNYVQLDVRLPPVNLAFDVIARANGKEIPIGKMTAAKNQWLGFAFNVPGQPIKKIDLIFRSSESAARLTTDLYEVWKGEIVLKDVVPRP